jgi:hypothetical protein
LHRENLSESIDFTFTDGALGCMSREEILAHLVLHGDYHRGAVSQVMTQLRLPTRKHSQDFCIFQNPPLGGEAAERRLGDPQHSNRDSPP